MERLITICAMMGLTLGISAIGRAGYVIDADLSDWGVTPFVDWVPDGTADYTQADDVDLYDAENYREKYDFEALYFDDDVQSFYFAAVTSYPLGADRSPEPALVCGDLGIDLDGDFAVSEHGVVTGLEYAVQISWDILGAVLMDPEWSQTVQKEWPDGWQGSPWRARKGPHTVELGSAAIAIEYYPSMEEGTYILEGAISRDIFPVAYDRGHSVALHLTHWCGNDSINLTGTVAVPEPATLLIMGVGAYILRRLRTRGTP
ncbi:MAG: PEP-CTERM sorting domain-containing protein [Phycisphaerales bacterium]|nr:MAG: PEP-CTERM sorting domain-containing protein [Phycisphaerales bacterium]